VWLNSPDGPLAGAAARHLRPGRVLEIQLRDV
jgi:hypothetical protein